MDGELVTSQVTTLLKKAVGQARHPCEANHILGTTMLMLSVEIGLMTLVFY